VENDGIQHIKKAAMKDKRRGPDTYENEEAVDGLEGFWGFPMPGQAVMDKSGRHEGQHDF